MSYTQLNHNRHNYECQRDLDPSPNSSTDVTYRGDPFRHPRRSTPLRLGGQKEQTYHAPYASRAKSWELRARLARADVFTCDCAAFLTGVATPLRSGRSISDLDGPSGVIQGT